MIRSSTLNLSFRKVLAVEPCDDGQFHTEDTTTVTLLGNGTSTTPLKATVIVDPASGNALVAGADGLSVGVSPQR